MSRQESPDLLFTGMQKSPNPGKTGAGLHHSAAEPQYHVTIGDCLRMKLGQQSDDNPSELEASPSITRDDNTLVLLPNRYSRIPRNKSLPSEVREPPKSIISQLIHYGP